MTKSVENILEHLSQSAACKDDCLNIARLYQLSSDGVADYIWSKLAEKDEPLLEVGARRYARENTNFSYQNCTLMKVKDTTVGMLFAFPMQVDATYVEEDPILKPYSELEEDASYYISGIAIHEQYRGQKLGSLLISKAHVDATRLGLKRLSLLVFEENWRAKQLYERLGFEVIDSRPVVPHPLIRFQGAVSLMSREAVKPELELVQGNVMVGEAGDTTNA